MSRDKDPYWRSDGCVYLCGYHLVWATKYRRKVLDLEDGMIRQRLHQLIRGKAEEHG
jgi:REP element-mobilizing transposase RayT